MILIKYKKPKCMEHCSIKKVIFKKLSLNKVKGNGEKNL